MTWVFSSPHLFAGPEPNEINTVGADFSQFKHSGEIEILVVVSQYGFRTVLCSKRTILWSRRLLGDLLKIRWWCSRCCPVGFWPSKGAIPQPLGVVCSSACCMLFFGLVSSCPLRQDVLLLCCICSFSCSCSEPCMCFNELSFDWAAVLCSFVLQKHPVWACRPGPQRSHALLCCCPM